MATLQIPEGVLEMAGLTEQGALVELACILFDKQRLSLYDASQLAGLTRTGFENACLDRGIPVYRFDVQDLEQDMRTLQGRETEQPKP